MSQVHHTKRRKKGEHLRFEDRQRLEMYLRENEHLSKSKRRSKRAIARLLGMSEATICRELKRGEVEQLSSDLVPYISYSSEVAQADYQARGTAKGKPLKIGHVYAFAQHVEMKILKEKYSPDAIIMELRRDGNPFATDICTRTLYSYIKQGVFLNVEQSSLRRGGRKETRAYEPVRRAHRGDGKSIIERPEEVETREKVGHWEMDCIEPGKEKGVACLLTMVERRSRELILIKLPSQTQESVIKAIDRLETKMGSAAFRSKFQSITTDNGSEFMDWRSIERSCLEEGRRTSQYFAHPNSSWERGSNENINGIIRWFIPKGSDIYRIKRCRINEIEAWINNLPRRVLGGLNAKMASARAEAA